MKTEVINKLNELFVSENRVDDVSRAFFLQRLRELFESSIVNDNKVVATLTNVIISSC